MIICQKEEVYTTDHGEEVVLLDMQQDIYYGLEGAAMELWKALENGPVEKSHILKQWKLRYDQPEKELESLLNDSLQELSDKQLIVVRS